MENVRMMRERCRRKKILLHHKFLFIYGLPHMIIENDIAG